MDTHEYNADEITVLWKPKVCIRAGVCVKMLPKVYNPIDRPWIKTENATAEELKDQITKCPSGALSYKLNS
ncbi:(4Fe-4S)-binding protein [Epilithonimonas ginsengisoli]|uniref:(4Fe-4S)-binding protein n=1 Tax=Epilithonimonas ginsengisoli TaxID=1245592 RepID=A0ABU4JL51_9FLAO|nr:MULTISPECIES: (4Fe-4S)-binding protein [Chryseobacterium group]MBV6881429.1 (4Fe-4S)-binding protein [Epilithonimonas sp. FP105]MDW8550429.1 (4Fe-4S)-binding protein [Epilithonimonas ginsengisoli]OAH73262.1 (4Fe-4S)-binding protein [Chryseobacterium sp. FP211-J200]